MVLQVISKPKSGVLLMSGKTVRSSRRTFEMRSIVVWKVGVSSLNEDFS